MSEGSLRPLLTQAQWQFLTEAESVAAAQGVRVMTCTPLAEWFGDLKQLDDAGIRAREQVAVIAKSLSRRGTVATHLKRTSILFSFVVVQQDSALCLAICDDMVARCALRALGVLTYTWDELPVGTSPAALVREARERFANRQYRKQELHRHHEAIEEELLIALGLHLPSHLDGVDFTADTQQALEAHLNSRRQKLVLLREIALSRFLTESAAVSEHEDSLRRSSSVDFMIYARHPHETPLAVLEYDGWHHREEASKVVNDRAKDALLVRAGVPFMRIASNFATARPISAGQQVSESRLRLPILVGILAEMSDLHLRNVVRDKRRAKFLQRRFEVFRKRAVGMRLDESPPAARAHAVLAALRDQAPDYWDVDEGIGWLPDADDAFFATLDSQLEQAGIDREAVSNFAIEDRPGGRIARGRLRLLTGAELSLITPSIRMVAPPLTTAECIEFVDRHLTRAFVDEAYHRIQVTSAKARG